MNASAIATAPVQAPAASTPPAAPLHDVGLALLPGDVVFDVGANFGDKTAALLARGVKVVSVEPQPGCVAVLNGRFGGNPNVTVIPKGLGGRPGLLEMSINNAAPALSTFSPEWMTGRFKDQVWDQKLDIAITTLDKLVQEFGVPRYIKIDVEGFEYEVITGLTQRVGIISFEFTNEFFANTEKLMKYLDNLGYRKFNFSLGERTEFALDQWVALPQLVAILGDINQKYANVWGDVYAN
jgi:FkbM family methyltransferase